MTSTSVLRTPEECFSDLPGYDFEQNYLEVDGDVLGKLRMHYVDEGPRDGPVVLMLHGEPTWSYLYRHMIPPVVSAGCRALAPDVIGFGKSDKPTDRDAYSYQTHIDWMKDWIGQLDLTGITLFCQDWGGLIGLRLAAEMPDRFDKIMAGNTMLPTGDHPAGDAFMQWREFSQKSREFRIGPIVHRGTARGLSKAEIAAYDAPFPDESYKAGARAFPALVPITPDDPASKANRAAWNVLAKWEKPFLTCFADKDPILGDAWKILHKLIPGCAGQNHFTTENAGHFLQEDAGPMLGERLAVFSQQ